MYLTPEGKSLTKEQGIRLVQGRPTHWHQDILSATPDTLQGSDFIKSSLSSSYYKAGIAMQKKNQTRLEAIHISMKRKLPEAGK